MAKKSQQQKLRSIIIKLSKKFEPDDILYEMSVLYDEFSAVGNTEAEVEYWLKLSRATGNLSSGAEKWKDEMIDELEEEEDEED